MKSDIKEVAWKRGYRAKLKPQTALNAVNKIRVKNNGIATAGLIVYEAKNARSPLHSAFEWDNDVCGEEFRLEQARCMLRSFVVVYKSAPMVAPQRHFVAITQQETRDSPERKVYMSTAEALQDPVARDELLGNAIRDAITYRRKYAALSELAAVFLAIDSLVSKAI